MSFICNREEIYFIDANRVRNQDYEYTHRRSERSICWNVCTDFITVNKFGAFSAIRRSLGQNGENVLISDFQMLASMHSAYSVSIYSIC